MAFSYSSAFVLGTTLLAASLSERAGSIVFESSVHETLAAAKKTKRLVAFFVTAYYAPGSHEVVTDCFKDKRLAEISQRTVNFRYEIHTASKDSREWVRKNLLAGKPDRVLVAPQIILLKPDGEVVVSASGRMTPGQIEWAWLEALARTGSRLEPSQRALPPQRLLLGKARHMPHKKAAPQPKSVTDVEERLVSDSTSYGRTYGTLVYSRSPKVIKHLVAAVGYYKEDRYIMMLEEIQKKSSRAWAPVAISALKRKEAKLRLRAAETLEVLAAKSAVPALLKALKKEKDDSVRQGLLRAIAASGPGERSTANALMKALRDKKCPDCRETATLALRHIVVRSAVEKGLKKALTDKNSAVRLAAASVIEYRRDPTLVQLIDKVLEKEQDEDVREAFKESVAVAKAGLGR